MDDRELLELAAKAAGIEGKYEEVYEMGEQFYSGFRMGAWKFWNPLTDDGDALRLAVTLKIPLQFPDWADTARTWGPKDAEQPCDEQFGSDRYAATRRAIVLAAAEIGKAME